MLDETVEFKCVPDKCLYNSDEYKIYGVFVNPLTYPDIERTPYGNVVICGNFQSLNMNIEYDVKAILKKGKRGWQYEVINIKCQKPNSLESSRAFLYEIITRYQTDVLLEVYPDIIDRIMNNRLDDVDLSKTHGIKDYTFSVIKKKVIENFKLAELVDEFQGLFNISVLKKLYAKYPSVERIREVLTEEPYKCLCSLGRIGFKTADELLLAIDETTKKGIEDGNQPALFFDFNHIFQSETRKKARCLGKNSAKKISLVWLQLD